MVSRLSQQDAFFVAYQELSGILMLLGAEVELECGDELRRRDLERALEALVHRFPPLAKTLHRGVFGLAWKGGAPPRRLLLCTLDRSALSAWRNQPIDPFREPPFRVVWTRQGAGHVLLFLAHHAVVDGEGLIQLCRLFLYALARIKAGCDPSLADNELTAGPTTKTTSRRGRGGWKRWPQMAACLRDSLREARSGRSAPLLIRAAVPGDVATVKRTLSRREMKGLRRRACAEALSPSWLCAAAWMRTLHRWNLSQDASSGSLLSLETPVTLRGRFRPRPVLGNWISPLNLFAEASLPLPLLATQLKQQFRRQIRRSAHLAIPVLTRPARYLPWPVFRRWAAHPATTGVATGHFTWLEDEMTSEAQISRLSEGRLKVGGQSVLTPVCLKMGAALVAWALGGRLELFINYRESAFTRRDAEEMADRLAADLAESPTAKKDVAL